MWSRLRQQIAEVVRTARAEGWGRAQVRSAIRALLPPVRASVLRRLLQQAGALYDWVSVSGSGNATGEISRAVRQVLDKDLKDAALVRRVGDMVAQGKALKDIDAVVAHEIGRARRKSETVSQTALAAFDRANGFEDAARGGITHFRYVGPPPDRAFCKAHIGKVYSLAQIKAMDNGQGLSVQYYCGGYNCRHRWVAAREEDAAGLRLSEALILPSTYPEQVATLKRAIGMIEQVHDVRLPKPVKVEWFSSEDLGGQLSRVRFSPVQINPKSDHLHMTLFHEMGHVLDRDVFGTDRAMATEMLSGPLDSVLNAIHETQAYTRWWQDFLRSGSIEGSNEDYLIEARELFARAYAQYIALKTKQPPVLTELNNLNKVLDTKQWTHEDFMSVLKSFEQLKL